MKQKVNPKLLVEHVGVEGGGEEYESLLAAIRDVLLRHPERRQILDGRASVQLRQLEKLRDAFRKMDAGARLRIEGLTTGPDGMPKPEIDLNDIQARIAEAINDLKVDRKGSAAKQRSTEEARNYTVRELAGIFRQHYQLERKDYREHLDAFLRGLLLDNGISYPKSYLKSTDSKQRDDLLRRLGAI